ncbi:MAG TPA: metal-sensitive transcriptional regulator [Patescibacteria group bacterium]|nr:metal-sensitive transcriptional regulator [Patescibacteria group bacterium]
MVDQKIKLRAIHRAKILKGQLEGLIKAIEREDYCPKLLAQSLSIQKSLKSLDSFLLENHLKTHVRRQMQTKDQDEKAIKELIEVYTLANK